MRVTALDILLAESDGPRAALASQALERDGFAARVRVVATFAELRAGVAAARPDLAVVRVALADGRAVDVIAPAASGGAFPVLVTTPPGDASGAAEVLAAGALACLEDGPGAGVALPHVAAAAVHAWREAARRRATEDVLVGVLGATTESVFLFEPDGTVLAANRVAAERLGRRPEELLGRSIYDFLAPELIERRRARIAEVLRTREPVVFEDVRTGRTLVHSLRPVLGADGSVARIAVFARDVTEERRGEEALRGQLATSRSAEDALRLQALVLDQIQDRVTVTDLAGTITYVNAAECALMGYPREALVGQPVARYGDDPARGATQREILETTLREGSWRGEVVNVAADGTDRVLDCRTRMVHDAAGRAVAICGIATDVTAQRRTDALLRARLALSEQGAHATVDELLRSALDAAERLSGSTIGFFHFVDRDEQRVQLRMWSSNTTARMCTATGQGLHYPVAEAGVWADCVHTRRPVIHNDYAALPHRKGLPEGHAAVVRELVVPIQRDGRIVAILGVGNKPCDYTDEDVAVVEALASMAMDVVARRRAEDGRAEVLRLLAHNPSVIYAIQLTPEGLRPRWFSDNLYEFTGFSPEDVSGQGWWAEHLHPEDRARVVAAQALPYEQDHRILEFRFVRKDGRVVWVRDEKRVVRDADGVPREIVGTWSDVTERVGLEEQLRQSQKMEAVGQLAGGVAHDFNNLLTVIQGNCSELLDELLPDGVCRDLVGDILEAGERAAALTRQLLAFSRRQVLTPRVVDLNAVVSDVTKILRRLLGEDIVLSTGLSPTLPAVRVDPSQMEQVVVNLAVNARDAMPHGGRLTIRTRDVILDAAECRCRPELQPGRHVVLSVADTGCGMPPEVRARIFEPFFTTKAVGRGTGLGLATVFGIVKQSGGFVEVESELGAGSTFRVYLPAHAAAATPTGERAGDGHTARGAETILLVEDEDAVRRVTRRGLDALGYAVLEASGGEAAVALVRGWAGPLDLVLSDVVMPEMSGPEVVERLRALRPGLKALFMTGHTEDVVIRHGLDSSGAGVLRKPFPRDVLARRIREALARGEPGAPGQPEQNA